MAKPSLQSLPGDRPDSSGWQYRAAFEKIPVATFLFDAANRFCLDANQEAGNLTGYTRRELLDLRLEDLHPRLERPRAVEHFNKWLTSPGFTYDDLPLETKEQGRLPVSVQGSTLGFDEGKAVLVHCRDLSEERLLQREVLFQSHKLTALNSLSSAISKSLDLSEILSDSLNVIMDASGSVYGEMLLYQEETRTFQLAVSQGDIRESPKIRSSGSKTAISRRGCSRVESRRSSSRASASQGSTRFCGTAKRWGR